MLSVASIWEMQIKLQLGKLTITMPLAELIESQQQTNNLDILPITLAHVLALQNLPLYHKDPFDRLLIAQAGIEEAVLISSDAVFAKYDVWLLW